ncbi:hypothetical protein AAFF_G00233130 [Aldrovandia affinis]|uniref:UPAR/Ly6 domain-containing protein n=1 Tax=Aldrovandia affinis TaxID=143900 RepID=A0AAD7RF96_9TELE|nr:hypothetical protein AAFF_G00233130 [Aldrovandia affinis]
MVADSLPLFTQQNTMKLLVTLALACALFSKVYPLQCYECIPTVFTPCTQTCPASQTKCGSVTVVTYVGSSPTKIRAKSCGAPAECVSGSFNFGIGRTVINTECCDTDLCNSQNVPDGIADTNPNGKKCFTCLSEDCTGTTQCLGSENRCIKSSVSTGGHTMIVKGCASQSICAGSLNAQVGDIAVNLSCCQGDLCNNALRVGQNVLLLLVPLASIVLFH